MLQSLFPMEPVESHAIMNSTNGYKRVQEPDHCLLPGAHVSPNWAPNWCECNFDLVNDPAYIGDNKCPGQDKPICAIHCESNFAFDLSCSDYSKYCYSINMNKCYCRY